MSRGAKTFLILSLSPSNFVQAVKYYIIFPFFFQFQYLIFRVAKGPFFEEFYQCVTHGFYTAPWQEQLYTTFTLIFMFIIPLVILTGTYLSTFRTIASK